MHHIALGKGDQRLVSLAQNIDRHLDIVELAPEIRSPMFSGHVPEYEGIIEASNRSTDIAHSSQNHTHAKEAECALLRIGILCSRQIGRADV
jgi:hypothetical protein